MSASPPTRVVIVGGGLSGLVAAWALHREALAHGRDVTFTLLEASDRYGGNLVTDRVDGFLIDGGPDSWVAAKPAGAALCRDLGLGDALIETVPANRRVYVCHDGALVPLPAGVVLGVPTRVRPMLRSPLLPWSARLRMLADLALPSRRRTDDDVSLGALVASRLGRGVVEALTEPLLAGVYAGNAWGLSARATFPQLLALAGRGGSLVRRAREAAPTRHPGDAPPSAFVSLRDGVGSLVDALVAAIPASQRHLRRPVSRVLRDGARWRVEEPDGTAHVADHVVLAMPAWRTAELVSRLDDGLAATARAIPYASAATAFFAWRRDEVPHALDATGFVVPRREGLRILAATWVSSKWPGRAPDGMVLMRAFVGGAGHDERARVQEDSIVHMAQTDLCGVMKIRAAPRLTRVYRFLDTSPQPTLGHVARVDAVRSALRRHPGLHVLGSAWNGVGIPDVIALARRAVQDMLARSPK